MRAFAPLAAAVLLVAGCGGGAAKDRERPVVESSASDCDFKEITAGPRREGTCTARGVAITVANRAHRLQGKQYDARILGVDTAATLGNGSSTLRPKNGRFVIARLAIRNTLGVPHEFDRASRLVFLFVDGKYFGESPEAENIPALGSFRRRSTDLRPGQEATGTVVFDVPEAEAKHLFARGSNLIFVNYEDEAKQFPTGTSPLQALGYVRLWK